jgi:hypothetical protein
MSLRTLTASSFLGVFLSLVGMAVVQAASPTSSGLTGAAAATALGAGLNSGSGSTSSANAGAGGASNAAIEINIMVYQGMARVASDIAQAAAKAFCGGADQHCPSVPILVEDPSSANQVGMYQALSAYYNQMQGVHDVLAPLLSLVLSADALPVIFSAANLTQTVTVTNTGVQNVNFTRDIAGSDKFTLDAGSTCAGTLSPGANCTFVVKYSGRSASDTAELDVKVRTGQGGYTYQVPLLGFNRAALREHIAADQNAGDSGAPAGATGTTGSGSGNPTGSSSSQAPQWATNFGTIGTAIEALKTGMSYSSASVQPTTQSFEVLVENELKAKGFIPYFATSPLDLQRAVDELTSTFVQMLAWSNDFTTWTGTCKPVSAPQKPIISACSNAQVQGALAAGQQILTGYTTFLQNSNDGQGNSVLMDVLRGAVLSAAMGKKFRSVQVNVAAAGGSTRVNSWFLENIFYVPKPSYNGGVIATFELRSEDNLLLQSGARTAFYDYNKRWKGGKFEPKVVGTEKDCDGTFCIAR